MRPGAGLILSSEKSVSSNDKRQRKEALKPTSQPIELLRLMQEHGVYVTPPFSL